jgi:hypothetical protein
MLAVAEVFPIENWRLAGEPMAELAWQSQEGAWRQSGVRPANLPRRRLTQYARWVAARPDWPEVLKALGTALFARTEAAGAKARHAALRGWIVEEICASELGGTRFDTWWCDAALPLLAANVQESAALSDEATASRVAVLQRCWQSWPIGDAPAELVRLAREFGVGTTSRAGRTVVRQGELQGLLGWLATLTNR